MHSPTKSNVIESQMDSELAIKSSETPNLIDNCKRIIKELYVARLVQKLPRPIEQQQREKMVLLFKRNLDDLHYKILEVQKAQTQLVFSNDRQRKLQAQFISFNKTVKQLYSQYEEVLVKGSFKHYGKVAILYNLQPMKALDISKLNDDQQIQVKTKSKCCFC